MAKISNLVYIAEKGVAFIFEDKKTDNLAF